MTNLRLLLSYFFLLWQLVAKGQNLLPNASYEEINICCEREAPCSPEGWFAQRIYPYQRNFISMEPVYKIAFSGNTSIEVEVGSDYVPDKYAFRCAVAPLLKPLIAGKEYVVSLNVLPKLYALKELHAVFSDTIFPNLFQAEPDITFKHKKDKFIIDGRNWVELQGIYKAKGGERFIHLGMIKPIVEMPYKKLTDSKGMGRYYIDDVSLVPLEVDTQPFNLDSARQFIYNENRRHEYDKPCAGSNILFMSLLKYRLDSITTLPGIIKRKTHVLFDSKLEERNVLFRLQYLYQDSMLAPSSYPIVKPILGALQKNIQLTVTLKGYVDTPDGKTNHLIVSLRHAKAVADYLVQQGIAATRIRIEGLGAADAIGNPDTPEGRALNNRVEYVFTEQ